MKRFGLVLGLMIFMAGLASAGSYWLEDHDGFGESGYKERLSVTNYEIYYDNDDRYSTYEYRHGYSYRTSRDFFERKRDYDWDGNDYVRVYRDYDRDEDRWDWEGYDWNGGRFLDWDYWDSGVTKTKVRYVEYLDSYEEYECYTVAPRDKLFYIEC